MCRAISYSKEVMILIEKAKKDRDLLRTAESRLDKMLSDIEHKLENMDKFNLYEGYEMAKSISIIRKRRRQVKEEFQTINLFLKYLNGYSSNNENIENTYRSLRGISDKKIYNNRVLKMDNDVIQEVERVLSEVDLC